MLVYANPYLVALWKNLWKLADKKDIDESLSDDDYASIASLSKLSEESLKRRVLRYDKGVLKKVNSSTLDSLCIALSTLVKSRGLSWGIPDNWNSFANTQSGKNIFLVCEQLHSRINKEVSTRLRNEISRNARDNANEIAGIYREGNLPEFPGVAAQIKVALESDVEKIYQFAIGQYGDCPINGPDIKLPWWRKNNSVFYVIHDDKGRVCANLNLLPLKKECYEHIRDGLIDERGIKDTDLFSVDQKDIVDHIYVEGFNCSPTLLASKFIFSFHRIIKNIADPENPRLVIGAIGGTDSGENLMNHLGFEVISVPSERVDDYKFFEVNFAQAYRRLTGSTF